MKLPKELLAAGLAASYQLRDKGDPARGIKPTSFTANPSEHVDAIGVAMMAALPFPSKVSQEEVEAALKAWAGDGTDNTPRDQYLATFIVEQRARRLIFTLADRLRLSIGKAEIGAFLNAQPFAESRNESTRVWQFFNLTEPEFLETVARAGLEAVAKARA